MIIEFRKAVPDQDLNSSLKKQVIEAFLQVNDPKCKA